MTIESVPDRRGTPAARSDSKSANRPAENTSGPGLRRGDIQGLRGIAVLLVVAYHAKVGFSGGFVGVDVFFVISGYVITRLLHRELRRTGGASLTRFYLRRIRRILPALGLLLTAGGILAAVFGPIGGRDASSRTAVAAALLNANTYLSQVDAGYFGLGSESNVFLHTWSLSVEEQFYLVFPVLLLGGWLAAPRLRGGSLRPSLPALVVVVTLISFALSCGLLAGWLSVPGSGADGAANAFYSAPSRAWEFGVGCLLALAAHRVSALRTEARMLASLIGLALIGYSALVYDVSTPFPGVAALPPVVGAAFVIAAGEGRPDPVGLRLDHRWLQRVGDVSYSWYLWHWPFIVFASALFTNAAWALPVAAVLALLPAVGSLRFVEDPIRHAQAPARRTVALGLACILLPVTTSLAVGLGVERIPAVREFDRQFGPTALDQRECGAQREANGAVRFGCVLAMGRGEQGVLLVGDSNADHFRQALVGSAAELGFRATVASRTRCPFIDLEVIRDGADDPQCASFRSAVKGEIERMRPDLVVLASASDGYINDDIFVLREPGSHVRADSAAQRAMMWERSLARTIEELQSAGSRVAIISPVPKLPGWDPRKCATVRWMLKPETCGASLPRDEAVAYRELAVRAEVDASSETEATRIDFFDQLCPVSPCRTNDGGRWKMRDGFHLSSRQSSLLAPSLTDGLAPLIVFPR